MSTESFTSSNLTSGKALACLGLLGPLLELLKVSSDWLMLLDNGIFDLSGA